MGSLEQPHSSWAGEEHRQRDQKGAGGQPARDLTQNGPAGSSSAEGWVGGELPTLLATAPPGCSSVCGRTRARSHTTLKSEVAPAGAPANGGETQDAPLLPCTHRVPCTHPGQGWLSAQTRR